MSYNWSCSALCGSKGLWSIVSGKGRLSNPTDEEDLIRIELHINLFPMFAVRKVGLFL